jgi:hypothetical protein
VPSHRGAMTTDLGELREIRSLSRARAVEGIRQWWAGPEGLQAIRWDIQRAPWPPKQPIHADCTTMEGFPPSCGQAPNEDCSNHCGIYLADSEDHLNLPGTPPPKGCFLARGGAHGWGKVLIHERGFRVEWAIPTYLMAPRSGEASSREEIEHIAREYGILHEG